MKLNASQLEAFFAIAQSSNFTRAAERLHVTQSALSQRIAKLEDELETTLFIRDRSALRLTEAGQRLLRFCQLNSQAEAELLTSLKDTQSELTGPLRIGGFSSVNRSLVIPALAGLLRDHSKLSLHLITKELWELPKLLKTAEVDYVLTSKSLESDEVESVFLGIEENVLAQSKKRPIDGIYLDHDESDPTTKAYFERNKLRFQPKGMRYLDDVYGLLDGVRNGLGMAVLPRHLIENERDFEILQPQKRLDVPVHLNFYKQPFYRHAHEAVVEAIRHHFAQRLRRR